MFAAPFHVRVVMAVFARHELTPSVATEPMVYRTPRRHNGTTPPGISMNTRLRDVPNID
jgi:hypothetical protein